MSSGEKKSFDHSANLTANPIVLKKKKEPTQITLQDNPLQQITIKTQTNKK